MATENEDRAPEAGGGEGFDRRLGRLEEIVGELENGGLELEPAIDRYKEGVRLLRECRGVLAGFKKQVEELGQGGVTAFEGDPDARP